MQYLSPVGLALLKELEGVRSKPYADAVGLLTLGVGHLLTRSELSSGKIVIAGVPVRYAGGLTTAQIDDLLRQDLAGVEAAINILGVPLSQGQHDALCLFCFNIGTGAFLASTLRKKLMAGDYAAVPEQLSRWTIAGGKTIPGLARRRAREIARWLAEDEQDGPRGVS